MSNLFSVPDKEKNFQGYMVFVLTIIWSTVIGVIVSMGFFFLPEVWPRWLTFLGISVFIAIVNLSINHFGHTRVASWSLTIMIWLLITIPCYSAGGIYAPGIISQMSVILTAGFLLGWRGGLTIGLLTMAVDFELAYLELIGQLPKPSVIHNPLTRWIGSFIPFGTILALQYYATNHLRTSLVALQHEISKREAAEKIQTKTLYDLGERVKELKTLYAVSHILQNEHTPPNTLFREIAKALPPGWQYPDITAARVSINQTEYTTPNYKPSKDSLWAEAKTSKGTLVHIEIVYLQPMPELDEGPFLKEERSLINMLVEMVKADLERRERNTELKDYKYALDIASIVSIAGVDGNFSFVNQNFCKASKYRPHELVGKHYNILWSGYHTHEYFTELQIAMENGKPFRGEFCNKAKDGSLYWVDTTIVPFLDENRKVYQYLSINHDITERKEAEEQIKESEQLIRKITSQVPGNTYMFEIEESGHSTILFSNRGTDTFNHSYPPNELIENPKTLREVLHEDDKVKFNNAMKEAYQTQSPINFQYRIYVDGHIRWRWMQAVPEKDKNEKLIWYGATSDITNLVDYIVSIEQIIFDIGHVIRRPISSMLGMTNFLLNTNLSEQEIKEISQKLHMISEEMDRFIGELNTAYNKKREVSKVNVDFSAYIDKRKSLFG